MKAGNVVVWSVAALFGLLWAGGLLSYTIWGGPPADAGWAAPLLLAVGALLAWMGSPASHLWALPLAGLIGFAAEYAGVRWGVPFSHYTYTRVLFPHFQEVPLVMIAAWMLLLAYGQALTAAWRVPRRARALVGALWLTAIDLVIDPLAAGPLDYWRWTRRGAYYGVPWQNFLGWFVVALAAFAVLPARPARPAPLWAGFSVVLFFTVIAWALGFRIPGGIGILLCGAHLATVAACGVRG